MITTVANAFISRLESIELDGSKLFRKVERSIAMKILQSPPSVAVILAKDGELLDNPVARLLDFDLVLAVSALSQDKGHGLADDIIDRVRQEFVGTLLLDAGVMPASVPFVRLEGMEKNLLIYTVRVRLQVVPAVIDENA